MSSATSRALASRPWASRALASRPWASRALVSRALVSRALVSRALVSRPLVSRPLAPMINGVTTVGAVALTDGPVEVITADAPVVGGVAVSTGLVAAAVPMSVMVCWVATPAAAGDSCIEEVEVRPKLTVTSGESLTFTWVTGVRREIA